MIMQRLENLRPCPKCGRWGYAKRAYKLTGLIRKRWVIGCSGCTRLTDPYLFKRQAVKQWNTEDIL